MGHVLKLFKMPVRDIKIEDFVRFETKISNDRTKLVFPVRYPSGNRPIVGLRIVSVCHETGSIVESNLPDLKPDSKNRLFPIPHGLPSLSESKKSTSDAFIVASILDSVVLLSEKGGLKSDNIVPITLADGPHQLPPEHLPFFESFDKLTVWFPNDTNSFESGKAFARKLGEKRCFMVSR